MPTPMATPALAGAGAMDQVPMLKAVAARVAVQKRKCREIFLTLSMLAFELKSWGRDEPHRVKMCKLSNNRHSGSLDWDDWVHSATRAGLAVSLQPLVNDPTFGTCTLT